MGCCVNFKFVNLDISSGDHFHSELVILWQPENSCSPNIFKGRIQMGHPEVNEQSGDDSSGSSPSVSNSAFKNWFQLYKLRFLVTINVSYVLEPFFIQVSGNTPHSSENPDWLNSSELSLKFSKKSNWLFQFAIKIHWEISSCKSNWFNQWILRTHFSGTFSTISSPGSSDGPSPVNARDDFLNESLMIRTQIRMEHLRFSTLSVHRMNSLGNSGTARSIIYSPVPEHIYIFIEFGHLSKLNLRICYFYNRVRFLLW